MTVGGMGFIPERFLMMMMMIDQNQSPISLPISIMRRRGGLDGANMQHGALTLHDYTAWFLLQGSLDMSSTIGRPCIPWMYTAMKDLKDVGAGLNPKTLLHYLHTGNTMKISKHRYGILISC